MLTETQIKILALLLYLVAGPFLAGLINGIDRRITARMQGRVGPPLLQPFYDIAKLWQKETAVINHSQNFFVLIYLVFSVFTGAIFFLGSDLLLTIFALTLAGIFLVLAANVVNSPYSIIGADRELLMMLADEPAILLTAVGFYLASGTFVVSDLVQVAQPAILKLPGIFLAFVYILTIKFRKSPFDLSTSHHGHQEIVKGLTTEFAGKNLALVEIAHWYETILLLGMVFLFFASQSLTWVLIGLGVTVLVYFLEIVIDNTFARVKWPVVVIGSWLVAAVAGMLNLLILSLHS
jgi:formate hydrogenlyase subunit 4